MMMPDLHQIVEIQLFSYSFQSAKALAIQVVTVFRLCNEQIISQPHYDFGMRAIQSVLSVAEMEKIDAPDKAEDEIIVYAIRKNVLCTLNDVDITIFEVFIVIVEKSLNSLLSV